MLHPDPAAVLGAAVSLYSAAKKRADSEPGIDLSAVYNGGDEFMRQVMRIATEFERWACVHVDFDAYADVWPYRLENDFGEACLSLDIGAGGLTDFDEKDCLRVAMKLRLPLHFETGLPVPVDVWARYPVAGSEFKWLRVRSVRNDLDDESVADFSADDDPYDEGFGAPYYGVYGVDEEGLMEHIADRRSYALARTACGGGYNNGVRWLPVG